MVNHRTRVIGAVAAAALALGGGTAWGQTPPSAQAPQPQPAFGDPGGEQAAAQRLAQRIADLHAELQISGQQEPAWQDFTAVMRTNAAEMNQIMTTRAQGFATMTATDDLRSYAEIETVRARQIGKLVVPFQTLYAEFSADQKRVADAVFRNTGTSRQRG